MIFINHKKLVNRWQNASGQTAIDPP